MANLEREFNEFLERIDLTSTKESYLCDSRDAIIKSVKNYFNNEENYNQPKFIMQGSMDMHTTINPLDEEYDIDCGIYIKPKNIDYKNDNTWPDIKELHNLVAKACNPDVRNVDKNKNTCVRVIYQKDYHVDIPIYIDNLDDEKFIPRLAHKKNGWIKSDAKANTNYFIAQNKDTNNNLRKIVMFLKAMVDYQNCDENSEGIKTNISGFELTMMACRDYTKGPAGLDTTWHKTLEEMLKKCKDLDESLKKPVTEDELWKNKTQADKKNFIKLLEFAQAKTRNAIKTQSEQDASIAYREIFGNRFPLVEDSDSDNKGQCTVVHPATQG